MPTDSLPLTATISPTEPPQVVEAVRQAASSGDAVYPLGGRTSLGFGLPATRQGMGLSLAQLARVVDFPARDMTITVEAGITMAVLAETLRREGQRLPIDVPRPSEATLGGVIATNFSGPRRFGAGTMRDYVIGISAVDGTGTAFKAGGRVVKNVAGYDLCKLLVGSLGTLAVVTQATLKVRPIPEAAVLMYSDLASNAAAEERLTALVTSQTTPSAIEWLAGPAWADEPALSPPAAGSVGRLLVGLEGTADEVAWMQRRLEDEWAAQGLSATLVEASLSAGLWQRMAEFPAQGGALVLKANLLPSATVRFVALLREIDPGCSVQAHAGNGVVIARFRDLPIASAATTIVNRLQPAARAAQGDCVVLSYTQGFDATRQTIWGGQADAYGLMRSVKHQLDPRGLLNPGRFVF